jgi:hypothetical protein
MCPQGFGVVYALIRRILRCKGGADMKVCTWLTAFIVLFGTNCVFAENEPQLWVFAVGVARDGLRYPVKDMKELLVAFRKRGCAEERSFLMSSDEGAESSLYPSKSNIHARLRAFCQGVPADATLVFAFSGHGCSNHQSGWAESFLIPADATEDTNTWLSMARENDVGDIVRKCRAKNKVFIIDACRSSANSGEDVDLPYTIFKNGFLQPKATPFVKKSENGYVTPDSAPAGTILISSSRNNQISLENEKLENGVFIHYFIQSLAEGEGYRGRNQSPKIDGTVLWQEVFDMAHDRTEDAVGKNDKGQYIQTPVVHYAEETDKLELPGKLDFSNSDLRNDPQFSNRTRLKKLYLRNARFVRSNLSGLDLSGLSENGGLSGADFTGAILKGTDFSKSDLTEAKLNRATCSDADFTETWLVGVEAEYANFQRARFPTTDSLVSGLNVSHSNCAGATGNVPEDCKK